MENVPERKRRVRYRGTHPRRFEEKYKELAPERYASEVQKVMQRGQTPAGMHRPICVEEILSVLKLRPGMIGLDATLGYGGHASRILKQITPGGRLFGIDVDPLELPRTEERLRAQGFGEDVLTITRMNFAGILQLTATAGTLFDFVLADLGVSSMQIDNPTRGFTFKHDGNLDLRLNPSKGRSAHELLQTISEEDLHDLLIENSDEPYAERIAIAICRNRNRTQTTLQLADLIRQALQRLPGATRQEETKKSLQRVFQALRIAVNDEFTVLDQLLEHLPAAIKAGGRAAILTFHSGEDRRVKKSFLAGFRAGTYNRIAKEPIRPTPQECHDNPRAACAKLRWAERASESAIEPTTPTE
jgi:16S rRNA (cytosine1402-N4)-methyltransferase